MQSSATRRVGHTSTSVLANSTRMSDSTLEVAVKNEYEAAANKIKMESELGSNECVLCAARTDDTFDIFTETTCCGQVLLSNYICRVANLNLNHDNCSPYTCYSCFELVNFIERAELEYFKQKNALLDIISQNPALANLGVYDILDGASVNIDVKAQHCKTELHESSEDDEPLIMLPSSLQKSEVKQESSPLDDRQLTSDEDFIWKEDTIQETKINSKTIKKPKAKQCNTLPVKKVKAEKGADKNGRNKRVKSLVKLEKTRPKSLPNQRKFTGPPLSSERVNSNPNINWPYICEICGKGFKIRRWCDAHVLLHQGIADFKCIPCNKLFPTKIAFRRHDKIHNGAPNDQCDLCGKSFIHKSSLRKHKLAHSGVRNFGCEVCGLAFVTNSKLNLHRLVHTGEKNFECAACGRKFSRKSNMQSHYERRHARQRPPTPPDAAARRKKMFPCDVCNEQFDRLFKLECHLVDEHKVHLKKGRPKPRDTVKKMQRTLVLRAADVFNRGSAMAGAATVAAAADVGAGADAAADVAVDVDVKPSMSTLSGGDIS